MDASEKLTIQALKEHDKVQPKFKAAVKSPTSVTSSSKSKDQKESKSKDVSLGKRSRTQSTSDSVSKRSEGVTNRQSGMTFFRIVAATRAWQRLAKKKKRPTAVTKLAVKLENTFKLGPDDGKHFLPGKAETIIQDVFESRLSDVQYNTDTVKLLATDLAAVLKAKVKALETPRYKIVCNVIIIENKEQSMRVVSRCIWNPETDSYATYTYRSPSLIAIGYVHAVYYE